jgi:catechol 2,3-dioxygenase-like lactoylglutathione lyase family enzyme
MAPVLDDIAPQPTLPVKDLERATAWYRDKLGYTPTSEQPGLVSYDSGGVSFVLYATMQQIPSSTLVAMQRPVPDIRATVQQLKDRGVVFERLEFPGVEWEGDIAIMGEALGAWFRDSEGNNLALIQAPAAS